MTEGVRSIIRVDQLGASHLPDNLLSIAVFGPGEGEAIVVRLPDGSVGVVDGCREPENPKTGAGDPVRELLEAINPARLAFVCLTHPHDDHYAGLGRLLYGWKGKIDAIWRPPYSARYAKALLMYQRAIRDSELPLPDDEKPAWLERVIDAMTEQRANVNFRIASEDCRLFEQGEVSIWSCGPAGADADQAEQDLMDAIDLLVREKTHKKGIDPNLTSSALLIRWKEAGILLAGDLLAATARYKGWKVAHQTIKGTVQVVNVAHHASEEAHDEKLWELMNPKLAIVTPFKHGATGPKNYPPRPHRISLLLRTQCKVAITTPPRWTEAEWQSVRRQATPEAPIRTLERRNDAAEHFPVNGSIRNAVAVSLDEHGQIQSIVLAGAADLYEESP